MKQISIIGLLLIAVSCKKNDNEEKRIPCIPGGLSNNVIAFYPFSNGSLNDMSGNQHHLTNPTSATSSSDRNGNTNCAYEFKNIPSSSELRRYHDYFCDSSYLCISRTSYNESTVIGTIFKCNVIGDYVADKAFYARLGDSVCHFEFFSIKKF